MVKDNQKGLLEQVKKMFDIKKNIDSNEQFDAGHGRVEKRKCEIITDLRFFDDIEEWKKTKNHYSDKLRKIFKKIRQSILATRKIKFGEII